MNTNWHAGDQIRYENAYGQIMEGVVRRVFYNRDGEVCLIVKRSNWYGEECINPEDYLNVVKIGE